MDIQKIINPTYGLVSELNIEIANLSTAIMNKQALIEEGHDGRKTPNLYERLYSDVVTATNILKIARRYLNQE